MSRFTRDTAVTAVGDGVYNATIDPDWWIIRGPNGGYLAAIVARAIVAEVAAPTQRLRSLTLHYLRVPTAGPCTVEVTIERRGRTLTTASARLMQDGKPLILALAATAEDRPGPAFDDMDRPDIDPPDAVTVKPVLPEGAIDVPMRHHFDIQMRLGPDRWAGELSERAVTGGWIRLVEPTPVDEFVITALVDAWAPAIFSRSAEPLGVPTVDLTIHFRDRPTGDHDWTLVRFTSRHASGGYVEEDGELWTADGRLLAQSRQLAVELPM